MRSLIDDPITGMVGVLFFWLFFLPTPGEEVVEFWLLRSATGPGSSALALVSDAFQ